MEKLNTRLKGKLAETKVELRALEKGITYCKPNIDARYDCILDDGSKLVRAQIKYCTQVDSRHGSSYTIDLRKHHKNTLLTYSSEEIDAIIAYFPIEDKIAFIPSSMFKGRIRLFIKKDKISANDKYDFFLNDLIW